MDKFGKIAVIINNCWNNLAKTLLSNSNSMIYSSLSSTTYRRLTLTEINFLLFTTIVTVQLIMVMMLF